MASAAALASSQRSPCDLLQLAVPFLHHAEYNHVHSLPVGHEVLVRGAVPAHSVTCQLSTVSHVNSTQCSVQPGQLLATHSSCPAKSQKNSLGTSLNLEEMKPGLSLSASVFTEATCVSTTQQTKTFTQQTTNLKLHACSLGLRHQAAGAAWRACAGLMFCRCGRCPGTAP